MVRKSLMIRALAALCEIADECGIRPAPKSLGLRFILAYTFVAAGADPARKWIWDSFWTHATMAHDPDRPLDSYIRGTGARSAFNGICREIGLPADNALLARLRGHSARNRPPVDKPAKGAPSGRGTAHVGDDGGQSEGDRLLASLESDPDSLE